MAASARRDLASRVAADDQRLPMRQHLLADVGGSESWERRTLARVMISHVLEVPVGKELKQIGNCPGRVVGGSSWTADSDQDLGVLEERLDDVPMVLLGG